MTGLVRPVGLDPTGERGPTKSQAAGPRWVRTDHGRYVPVDAPRHLVEQRILEQSVRLPAAGAVTGWAASRLLGAAYFDGVSHDGRSELPVPLAVGPHRSLPATPRALPHNHVLLPRDRTRRYGIPTVIAQRATYDAVRFADDVREGVVAIDMMAAAGLCSLRMLREYAADQPQDRARVLRALALASEHALSPVEVDVRLIYELDARLPRPEVNCFIYDLQGRRLAMADLLDVNAGLVIEVDGAHHRRESRRSSDQSRTDALHRVGLEVTRVTGAEARRRRLVVERIKLARSRCRFERAEERAWFYKPQPDVLDAVLGCRRDHDESLGA